MARYSGATWRPVAWANARDDNTDATIVILHVTATNADSQYNYFLTSRAACSHFHIALDGHTEQYIDTSKLSAADNEGSDNAISIETAGTGGGSWTAAQERAIERLLAWIHTTHGIPLILKTTSSPTERGIGWHRLGIVGNFPSLPSILAGRNQRGMAGEAWSISTGKVCPGDKRIQRMPAIIAAAVRLLEPEEENSMALFTDAEKKTLLADIKTIRGLVDDKVLEGNYADRADPDNWVPLTRAIRLGRLVGLETRNDVKALRTEVSALRTLVTTMAQNQNLDPERIYAVLDENLRVAFADLRITSEEDADEDA